MHKYRLHLDLSGDRVKAPSKEILQKFLAKNQINLDIFEQATMRKLAEYPSTQFLKGKQSEKLLSKQKYYERVLKKNPVTKEDFFCFSYIFFSFGKYNEALSCFKKALFLDPTFTPALIDTGYCYYCLEEYEKCLKCFKNAIHLNPKIDNVYTIPGCALIRLNQREEAIVYFRKAIELNEKNAYSWHNLGFLLLQKEQIKSAYQCYLKAFELSSDQPQILGHLGSIFILFNQRLAEQCLRKAIQYNHNDVDSILYYGYLHQMNGRINQAIECYLKIIEVQKDHFQALHHIGRIFYQKQNCSQASKYLQRAVEIKPNNFQCLAQLGLVLIGQGKQEQANKLFLRSIQNQINEKALIGLVKYQLLQSNYQQALQYGKKCFQINPKSFQGFILAGIAVQELGNYQIAIRCFEKARDLNPTHPEPFIRLADVLRKIKQYQSSIRCFQKALILSPSNKHVLVQTQIQFTLSLVGNLQVSKQCFKRIIKLNPNNYRAFYCLGNNFYAANQREEAIQCYKKAIEINQNFREAVFALANLLTHMRQYEYAYEYFHCFNQRNKKEYLNYFPYFLQSIHHLIAQQLKQEKKQTQLIELFAFLQIILTQLQCIFLQLKYLQIYKSILQIITLHRQSLSLLFNFSISFNYTPFQLSSNQLLQQICASLAPMSSQKRKKLMKQIFLNVEQFYSGYAFSHEAKLKLGIFSSIVEQSDRFIQIFSKLFFKKASEKWGGFWRILIYLSLENSKDYQKSKKFVYFCMRLRLRNMKNSQNKNIIGYLYKFVRYFNPTRKDLMSMFEQGIFKRIKLSAARIEHKLFASKQLNVLKQQIENTLKEMDCFRLCCLKQHQKMKKNKQKFPSMWQLKGKGNKKDKFKKDTFNEKQKMRKFKEILTIKNRTQYKANNFDQLLENSQIFALSRFAADFLKKQQLSILTALKQNIEVEPKQFLLQLLLSQLLELKRRSIKEQFMEECLNMLNFLSPNINYQQKLLELLKKIQISASQQSLFDGLLSQSSQQFSFQSQFFSQSASLSAKQSLNSNHYYQETVLYDKKQELAKKQQIDTPNMYQKLVLMRDLVRHPKQHDYQRLIRKDIQENFREEKKWIKQDKIIKLNVQKLNELITTDDFLKATNHSSSRQISSFEELDQSQIPYVWSHDSALQDISSFSSIQGLKYQKRVNLKEDSFRWCQYIAAEYDQKQKNLFRQKLFTNYVFLLRYLSYIKDQCKLIARHHLDYIYLRQNMKKNEYTSLKVQIEKGSQDFKLNQPSNYCYIKKLWQEGASELFYWLACLIRGILELQRFGILHLDLCFRNTIKIFPSEGRHVYKIIDFDYAFQVQEGQGEKQLLFVQSNLNAINYKYAKCKFSMSSQLYDHTKKIFQFCLGLKYDDLQDRLIGDLFDKIRQFDGDRLGKMVNIIRNKLKSREIKMEFLLRNLREYMNISYKHQFIGILNQIDETLKERNQHQQQERTQESSWSKFTDFFKNIRQKAENILIYSKEANQEGFEFVLRQLETYKEKQ